MSTQANPLLYDAMNLFYRSYHGNEKLTNSKGDPTGAIYAFLRTVLGLQRKYKDFEPVFIFDAFPESALFEDGKPDQTFSPPLLADVDSRKSVYKDYKANRSHMPDEMLPQCWPLALLLHGLGYPVVIASGGVEGDDIIGTLCALAKARGLKVKIASGDKDLRATIDNDCQIYSFNDKLEYDTAKVIETWGITPSQVAELLALMGDDVDEIPGVPKCGKKTAAKWLNQYQTLQGVIENADSIKGVVGENLRASLNFLPRNLILTTLKTDLPLSYEACTTKPEPNRDLVQNIFERLEIKAFEHIIPKETLTSDLIL